MSLNGNKNIFLKKILFDLNQFELLHQQHYFIRKNKYWPNSKKHTLKYSLLSLIVGKRTIFKYSWCLHQWHIHSTTRSWCNPAVFFKKKLKTIETNWKMIQNERVVAKLIVSNAIQRHWCHWAHHQSCTSFSHDIVGK